MLIGVLFPAVYGALTIDILPRLNIVIHTPISYAVAIGWLFIAIAIWKYNLFNITTEFASRKIISSIKDALLLINYNGFIIEANEAFYSMFQVKPQEIEEKPVHVFFRYLKVPEISHIREYTSKELTIKNIGLLQPSGKKMFMDLSTFFINSKRNEVRGYAFLIRNSTKLVLAQKEIEKQHEEMIKMAHQAGIAEFATNIMHNIGNVLNSVSVSSEHMISMLQNSKIQNFIKSNLLLETNKDNIAEFLSTNPKGKVLPEYYIELGKILDNEHKKLLSESKTLSERVRTMKEVIDIQQEYATTKEFYELEDINLIIDETIQILETSIKKHKIKINRQQPGSLNTTMKLQKSKLLNVLLNIMKNSIEALKTIDNINRNIIIRLKKETSGFIIEITDNGIGIHADELSSIFAFGYSNKPKGHGFGLHFCANAMKEMKGTIAVESQGLNKGAKFILTLPSKV
jgi:PAS domain S-box-containing protein